jgi:hypothetical protein
MKPTFKANTEPSPRDHWFRSSDWDTAAQAEFERRLARAQPSNRIQYRRIKALALLHGPDQGGRLAGYEMLASLVRDGDAPNMEKVSALSEMARFDQERGWLDDAERNYRVALAAMRSNRSGGNGEEEIRLAEILIDRGDSSNLDEAKQLLEQRAEDPPPSAKRLRQPTGRRRHWRWPPRRVPGSAGTQHSDW